MHLIHEATAHQPDGLIEVSVIVVNRQQRRYTYVIGSEHTLNKFLFYLRKKLYGNALNILNKFKVKGGKESDLQQSGGY